MNTRAAKSPSSDQDRDHVVTLRDVPWSTYVELACSRGEEATPRLSYRVGVLEVMSPGRRHEEITSRLGRLLEVWLLEQRIDFDALGSWTLRDSDLELGAEPDECYTFSAARTERPQLVLEVEVTHRSQSKLDIYHAMGIEEVWWWRDDALSVFVWEAERYRQADASALLPGVPVKLLETHVSTTPLSRAIREFRTALGS